MAETVHNRIAMLRAERKVSRRELADALGVHYQTIGYLERGEYSPSLYLALRIAEYFEVPTDVVFSIREFPRIGCGSCHRRDSTPFPLHLGTEPEYNWGTDYRCSNKETRTMAKLTKMVSAIGSLKDLNSARAEFDDASKTIPAEAAFPPADIRPSPGGARTVFLRVTNPVNLAEAAPQSATTSQGDTFAVIHVPAAGDFAAVVVFNPSTQVESGQNFASIADEGGWPVTVAMAEEFLGIRIDHIAELGSAALGKVIDELGPLPVYSRTAFSAGDSDFVEGTNTLDGVTSAVFTAADPVDDAGQTRTRNQRAVLRALIQGLKSAGLAKDPNNAATVLGHFASGIQHNAELTTVELGKIANSLRALQADDIAVVTVPTNSRRNDDGTVIIDFDPEAMPAMKSALAGNDLPEFFRYLVSLGY